METPDRSNDRWREGTSLTELGLGVATILVVGLLIGWYVAPAQQASRIEDALRTADGIRQAAESWREETRSRDCPTISVLIEAGRLERDAKADDPWGERFRIRCSDDDVTVVSPGPDGRFGTGDDVRTGIPRS